jgi:hypothetical protein
MKRYLQTVAFALAIAFFAVSAPATAANETTAKAKMKITEIRCHLKAKICQIKCKKDATCKTKCTQDEKTCANPLK